MLFDNKKSIYETGQGTRKVKSLRSPPSDLLSEGED